MVGGHYFDKGLELLVWTPLHQKFAVAGLLFPKEASFLYKDKVRALHLTSYSDHTPGKAPPRGNGLDPSRCCPH